MRSSLLHDSSTLAHLSPPSLERLTNAEAKYLVGWSHGKETLRPGVVDTMKGSYYVNCAFYQDDELEGPPESVQERFPDFPQYTARNLWPEESGVAGMREHAHELIRFIIDVAVHVARACDAYAEAEVPGYQRGYLEKVVTSSYVTKARLLHYFPSDPSLQDPASQSDQSTEDDWCATHIDHGCLTGLTSAMFLDESDPSSPPQELPSSPDPTAGLYIHSRSGSTVKVNIPRDCLAFQTGEALELMTKGRFKAVPHYVKGAKTPGRKVARNTLAVFTQPNLDEVVDLETGLTFGEFARGVVKRNTTTENGSATSASD